MHFYNSFLKDEFAPEVFQRRPLLTTCLVQKIIDAQWKFISIIWLIEISYFTSISWIQFHNMVKYFVLCYNHACLFSPITIGWLVRCYRHELQIKNLFKYWNSQISKLLLTASHNQETICWLYMFMLVMEIYKHFHHWKSDYLG